MIDFATARRMMVDGQVRPNDVTDLRLIAAMLEVPRERFLPPAKAQLAYLDLDIPVLAYGLRTDFQANLFEGSAHLLALADTLVELKAVCDCGRKATMNLRVDSEGRAVAKGASIEIGGNDRYISLCRRHFMARLADADGEQLRFSIARAERRVEPEKPTPISC